MSSSSLVRLVEDDQTAGASLALLLKSAGLPTEVYDSGEGFLRVLPEMDSGCVVTDLRLPDMTGLDLLRSINLARKAISVIVITGYGDIPQAVEAMKLGAYDFFEKPLEGALLVAAIRAALSKSDGLREADQEWAETAERMKSLSPRERAVLDGLVAGKPNKLIAFDLNISPRTVEIYRANVMHKMQVASLSKLVRLTLLVSRATH